MPKSKDIEIVVPIGSYVWGIPRIFPSGQSVTYEQLQIHPSLIDEIAAEGWGKYLRSSTVEWQWRGSTVVLWDTPDRRRRQSVLKDGYYVLPLKSKYWIAFMVASSHVRAKNID